MTFFAHIKDPKLTELAITSVSVHYAPDGSSQVQVLVALGEAPPGTLLVGPFPVPLPPDSATAELEALRATLQEAALKQLGGDTAEKHAAEESQKRPSLGLGDDIFEY